MSFILLIILIGLAIFILVFYGKRKKTIVGLFKEEWRSFLNKKVRFYRKLSVDEKIIFEKDILSFLSICKVSGIDTKVSDEDRLLVAASAVIPIFGFRQWEYTNIHEVLLYPNSFNTQFKTEGKGRNILGQVGWGYMNGTMILSREALLQGFENEQGKSNVGIHEFVHLIDKLDGSTDGIPEVLMEKQYAIPWLKMVHDEMGKIREHNSDINPYGATNEAEFLSVAGEYFFNQPELFKKKHPELYVWLEKMFNHKDKS